MSRLDIFGLVWFKDISRRQNGFIEMHQQAIRVNMPANIMFAGGDVVKECFHMLLPRIKVESSVNCVEMAQAQGYRLGLCACMVSLMAQVEDSPDEALSVVEFQPNKTGLLLLCNIEGKPAKKVSERISTSRKGIMQARGKNCRVAHKQGN